jgi:hypothetical protein
VAAVTSTEITTLLLIAQASITFLISFRAFFSYFKTRHDLHFILGLAMGIIAIVGVIGIIGDNYLASSFSTKWFRYAAQIVSYTFIFLASLNTSGSYLRRVVRWQLIFAALLLVALFLVPLTPQFANSTVEAAVSSLRGVICFIIFLNYMHFFLSKETRFSFLMALSFLLISAGILVTTPQYFIPTALIDLYIGDAIRIAGLLTLLVTFFVG